MLKKFKVSIFLIISKGLFLSNLFCMQNLNQNLEMLHTDLSELNKKISSLSLNLSKLDYKLVASQPGIARKQIFNFVTGLDENSGKYNENFPIKEKFETKPDGFVYIKNSSSDECFCCGKITFEKLRILRAWDVAQGARKVTPSSFTFIFYTDKNKSNFSKADICSLQADPENKDAVFQLASRFHGLEGGTAHDGVLNSSAPYGFNQMLHGPTQGEFASFSAAPGTIYKIYGLGPINILEDTVLGDLVDPRISGGGMPSLCDVAVKTTTEGWEKDLKIYFHEHIQVVASGSDKSGTHKHVSKHQFVNQIPVAAFDWRNNVGNPDMVKIRGITHDILTGFYEGTLLSCAMHNKTKVYLTVVGGGAFENDHDLIMAAITNERCLDIISKYGLRIFLVMHKRPHMDDLTPWSDHLTKAFNEYKKISYKLEEL